MHRTHRTDGNHTEIMKALRRVSCHVTPLSSTVPGVPDILVSRAGKWFVLEIKSGNGELSPDQEGFINQARAPVQVVRSVDEALRAVGATR